MGRGKARLPAKLGMRVAVNDFDSWMHSLDQNGVPLHQVTDIEGAIPTGLAGTLYRNGPALFERGDTAVKLLDGDGCIVAVAFGADGRVWMSAKFVETVEFRRERAAGKILSRGCFGTRSASLRANYGIPTFKNAANTNTIAFAGRMFALWEGSMPYEIDATTLETVGGGPCNLGGILRPGETFSAHPAIDRARRHMVNIGANPPANARHPFSPDQLLVWELDERASGPGLVSRQKIDLLMPYSMMHDFKVTEDYVCFLQAPLRLSLPRLLLGEGVGTATYERADECALLYVVRRQTSRASAGAPPRVAVFRASRMFSYHAINAFQRRQSGELVVDVLATERYIPLEAGAAGQEVPLAMQPIACVGTNRENPTRAVRLVAQVANLSEEMWSGKVVQALKEEQVMYGADGRGIEMVAINPAHEGRPYRYAFCVDMCRPVVGVERGWAGIVKCDWQTGQHQAWFAEEHRSLVGDPAFVPRRAGPDGQAEDSGWVLSHVFDPVRLASSVVVLDAATMQQVARVNLDVPLPMGFHTLWHPSKL